MGAGKGRGLLDSTRIRYFITLAEQLHFGRAADLLYISQSSLSYHISELERELSVKLFTRSRRKVLLTSAGTALLPAAREFMQSTERLEQAAAEAKDCAPAMETLKLCFDSSFERFDLLGISKAISQLRVNYPALDIRIEVRELPALLAGTETMAFDIGIGILRNDEKAGNMLNVLPLYDDPLALVYNLPGEEEPTAAGLLTGQTIYLIRDDVRWTDYIVNHLSAWGAERPPVLLDHFSDILTRVYLGDGVTILPLTQFKAEAMTRPGLRAIPMKDVAFQLRTCAFWSKGNYNYAITQFLSGIQLSPEVSGLFW